MSTYPFVTNYTCGSFLSGRTRMPSAILSTKTRRFFKSRSGTMTRIEPDVLYHVQAVENIGPEGTFVHIVLEHPDGATVVEVPIEEMDTWDNVSLN